MKLTTKTLIVDEEHIAFCGDGITIGAHVDEWIKNTIDHPDGVPHSITIEFDQGDYETIDYGLRAMGKEKRRKMSTKEVEARNM